MFFSYKDAVTFMPVIISGVVHDQEAGLPVGAVRISVLNESASRITAANGAFSVPTWQRFPITILIQRETGAAKYLRVKSARCKLFISLQAPAAASPD